MKKQFKVQEKSNVHLCKGTYCKIIEGEREEF